MGHDDTRPFTTSAEEVRTQLEPIEGGEGDTLWSRHDGYQVLDSVTRGLRTKLVVLIVNGFIANPKLCA